MVIGVRLAFSSFRILPFDEELFSPGVGTRASRVV